MHRFEDFPFKHRLTSRCIAYIHDPYTLTGFCDGDVIGHDISVKLFFKAGYDVETINMIESEHKILMELQDYDFIPSVICTKQMGRYYIIFMELIDAISLDSIQWDDPRYKIGIQDALNILHKLYIERGFLHKDMHPNNIMIGPDNKVYLIDFSSSYLSSLSQPDKTWIRDLIVFAESLEPPDEDISESLDIFSNKLENIRNTNSLDVLLYRKSIIELTNILFGSL